MTSANAYAVEKPYNPAKANAEFRIFVSIVSHRHESLILTHLKPHLWQAEYSSIIPVICSNLPSKTLKTYCDQHNLAYSEASEIKGFGENNNFIFSQCEKMLKIDKNDYFFLINPDIITSAEDIRKIAEIMRYNEIEICAPNLVNDRGEVQDNIRTFPTLTDCVSRWLLRSAKSAVNKEAINEKTPVDWASGAYLCFKASTFRLLEGFDINYFMYYEDVDICRRAKTRGIRTYYIPNVVATHLAARESRKPLSRLTFTHIKSALRFLFFRQNA